MAKKTSVSTENAQDSAQDLQQPAKKTVVPQAEVTPQAASTLPFAQKRDELINKFRANAVPREADYKQLLDQHYDVAGALGMANSADNNGGKTGSGLTFNTDSKKLEVLAKAQGGLSADETGVQVVHNSSLTVGQDGLALNVKYNPVTDITLAGINGLTTNATGQLCVSLFHNTGSEENVGRAASSGAVKANNGLWIHVGSSSDQSRKGLKGYKGNSTGNVLGVDHDDTLKIDSAGKLGVRPHNAGGIVTSANGLMLNTDGMSGLKVENNALKLDIKPGFLLSTSGNTIGVDQSDKAVMDWCLLVARPTFYAHTDDYRLFFYCGREGKYITTFDRASYEYGAYNIFIKSELDGVPIFSDSNREETLTSVSNFATLYIRPSVKINLGSTLKNPSKGFSVTFKRYV